MDITSPALKDKLSYVIDGDVVHMTYGSISSAINKSSFIQSKGKVYTDASGAYASSVTYENKVNTPYDDRYYYCWGYSGSADYIKIGCNLNYQIRYDTLSDTRKKNVDKYTEGIDESNSHYDAAVGYLALGFTGTLSTANAGILQIVDGNTDFCKARDNFDTIKGYGTKI